MGILQYAENRKNFYDGVGTMVSGKDISEVLQASELDYTVRKEQLYFENGTPAKDVFATVRDTKDGPQVLGHVGKQYTILQNIDAFNFLTDVVRTGELEVVNAGCVDNGKRAYICAKTEPFKVLDDDIDPYIVFMNSFDGFGSVRVMFTPVRVFCSNCEVIATKNAKRAVSVKHSRQVVDNLYIAGGILLQNTEYLNAYKEEMEQLATMRVTRQKFAENIVPALLKHMGLMDEAGEAKERKRDPNVMYRYRDELLNCWSKADLANYENTAYNVFQAISDWETHYSPLKNKNNGEIYFERAVRGMVFTNWVLNYMKNSGMLVSAR